MPGMNSGIKVSDPTVIAAFRAALLHQAIIVLLIFAVLGLAWLGARALLPAAAWSGRGFWQGTWPGRPGTLTGVVQSMAAISQPHFLSALLAGFGSVNAGHGFAVNLVVVAALALAGPVFLSGRPRLIRPALIAVMALCLADWVLIEDLGIFGGLGTDPNSMLPFALLAVAGYLALVRVPAAAEPAGAGTAVRWRDRVRLASLWHSAAAGGFRAVAAATAVGVIILGAAPMAAAQASGVADPIMAHAIGGSGALAHGSCSGAEQIPGPAGPADRLDPKAAVA